LIEHFFSITVTNRDLNDVCFRFEIEPEQPVSLQTLIERASKEPEVREALTRSIPRLRIQVEKLLKEFLNSEAITLIRQRRIDALFKLKELETELKSKKLVCIDIEATDVSTKPEADIIQVSICDRDGKEVLNQLINPGYDIPENEKHNITTEMVADAPYATQVWDTIHQTLLEADTILAYSTESDFAYLENTAKKKQLPFELDYAAWLDVAELARDLIGAMRWHNDRKYWFFKTPKLTDAYEKIVGEPFPGDAHNALDDACATMRLFLAMLERGRKADIAPKQKKKAKKEPAVTNNLLAMAFAQAKQKNKEHK
jgi:DNA polymerase-3 subunit epsilon